MTHSLATAVDVERLFSRGQILLPHLRNGLSAQSVQALLCLGDWSELGLVKDDDVLQITAEDEPDEDDSNEMDTEFPAIDISIL